MKVSITAKSVPFHDEPDYASEFFEEIGRIVALWGRFDMQFTELVLAVSRVTEHKFDTIGPPVSLKGRLKAWRKMFNTYDRLSEFKAGALEFASAVSQSGSNRNVIMHSHWEGFDEGDPPKIRFRNVRRGGDKFLMTTYTINLDQLVEARQEIDNINIMLVSLFWNLGSQFGAPI